MKDQLVKKYQLEVKDLFEADYHKIITDEDLVERLISLCRNSSHNIDKLENVLHEAHEDLYTLECIIDRLRDEIMEFKG
tara:strand:- start:26070 stop:26306 length:237 start_codon:yes stop_codon:yes gene_type:complete